MISVITITFNNYEELLQTIDSLYGIDGIDHIVVNGGRCEKTKIFLKESFKGTYISEPDKGISDAFNKGVRLAKGLGIAFLNSGDLYIGKDYYTLAENSLLKDSNLDFVHSNLLFKDSIAGELLMKPTMSSLGSGMPYFHPTMVVRKSVFEKIGYFSLDKKIGMDFDFVCRMEKHKMKGHYIDQSPVVFMDGSGISATQEPRALIECKESLKSHGLYNFTNAKDLIVRKAKLQFRLFLLNNFPSLLIKIKKNEIFKMIYKSRIEYLLIIIFASTSIFPILFSLKINNSNIRWAYLFLLLFSIINLLFEERKLYSFIKNNILFIFYILYLLIHLFIFSLNFRSLGFWLWLALDFYFLSLLSKKHNIKLVMKYYQIAILLNSFVVIFNHIKNKFYPFTPVFGNSKFYPIGADQYVFRSFGYFSEPSYAALAIFPFLIFLTIKKKFNRFDLISFLVLLFSLGLTYSRTALLCVVVIGIFLFSKYSKRSLKYLIVVVFTLLYSFVAEPKFFINDGSMPTVEGSRKERTSSISRVIDSIYDNKLIGVGLGNSLESLKKSYPDEKYVQGVHNLYLEILFEQGIIGFLFIIYIFIKYIRKVPLEVSLPFILLMAIPFQFCQTITVPVLWIFFAPIFYEFHQPQDSSIESRKV